MAEARRRQLLRGCCRRCRPGNVSPAKSTHRSGARSRASRSPRSDSCTSAAGTEYHTVTRSRSRSGDEAARHHQHRRRQDDGRRAGTRGGVVVEGGEAGVMRRVVGQPIVARQRILRRGPVHEAHRAVVGVQDQLRQPGGSRGVQDVRGIELDHRHVRRLIAGLVEHRRPWDVRHRQPRRLSRPMT